jgi:long-chain acyl-CoA synthetase
MKSVMLRMESAGRLRRGIFNFFMKLGRRVGERILDREPVALSDRLLYGIGRLVIFNPLMDNLGLSRVRVATTGGDAIGPDVFNFFRALGMNLKQIYGQMEVSMFVTMQRNGQIKANTVGTPAKDVEIKIADTGEVLYRGPGAFVGYCNDPEATRTAKDAKGWVHTGDIGFFDGDGHLCIIDRVSDLDRLNDGTLVAPKYIENKLRFSPYIKTAVAFGNRRDCVAVFINIDPMAVGAWAQQRNLWYSGYADLAGKTEVCDLIADCVAKVNAELAAEVRLGNPHIRHFMILDKELNADDGELTRTRKIRRHFIAQKYAPLIDALYAGQKGGPRNARETHGAREEGDAGGGPGSHQEPTFDSAPTATVG